MPGSFLLSFQSMINSKNAIAYIIFAMSIFISTLIFIFFYFFVIIFFSLLIELIMSFYYDTNHNLPHI